MSTLLSCLPRTVALVLGVLTALVAGGSAAEPDATKKEPSTSTVLKQRLKPYEDKLAEIRTAMLKECDDAIKKVEEIAEKAQKDVKEAKNDAKARNEANVALNKARNDLMKLTVLRANVARRIELADSSASRPEEQRLGVQPGIPIGALAAQLGLKKDEGILIERVDAGSPAAKAGLQRYDVLLKIDDKPVPNNPLGLRKLLAGLKPDVPADVVVIRQGKQETIKVAMPGLGGTEPKKPDNPQE